MAVYKKNESWFIDYYIDGKRVRESIGPGVKKDAINALAKRKVQIKENRLYDKKVISQLTFQEAAKEFLALKDQTLKSPRNYHNSFNVLLPYLKDRKIYEIKSSELENIIQQRKKSKARYRDVPVKAATVNQDIAFLSALFTYLERDEKIESNPAKRLKKLPTNNEIGQYITPEDFNKLHFHASDTLKPILIAAYDTGMRRGELLNLTWDRVDLNSGEISLQTLHTKTSRPRTVVMTPRVKNTLKSIPRVSTYVFTYRGERLKDVKKSFESARKKAGLSVRFHDLRVSFVTRMTELNIPVQVIMNQSGHTSQSVFKRYNKLTIEQVKAVLEKTNHFKMDTCMDKISESENLKLVST